MAEPLLSDRMGEALATAIGDAWARTAVPFRTLTALLRRGLIELREVNICIVSYGWNELQGVRSTGETHLLPRYEYRRTPAGRRAAKRWLLAGNTNVPGGLRHA